MKRKNSLLGKLTISFLLLIALFLIYLSFFHTYSKEYDNAVDISDKGKQYYLDNVSKYYLVKTFEPYSSLDPEIFNKALKIVDNKEVYIIDVRTPMEYKAYRINKSININLYGKDFEEKINKLDRNKVYLIYCRSGHRSSIAKEKMRKLGFKYVYDLKGGILNWINKNYSLIK